MIVQECSLVYYVLYDTATVVQHGDPVYRVPICWFQCARTPADLVS